MKHRLFLAIEIPPTVTRPIVELQNRLDGLGLPVVWEPEEKLHITTNFIGKVDQDKQSSIQRGVSGVCSGSQSFSLSLVFLETLYRKHDSSIVYLHPGGDLDALNQLQAELSEVMVNRQLPQPEKFLPHLTIGKLKKMDPVMTKDVLQQIRDVEITRLPEFRVESLSLYESLLSREGSHYQRVSRFMLN